jgi:hypothetical protein
MRFRILDVGLRIVLISDWGCFDFGCRIGDIIKNGWRRGHSAKRLKSLIFIFVSLYAMHHALCALQRLAGDQLPETRDKGLIP